MSRPSVHMSAKRATARHGISRGAILVALVILATAGGVVWYLAPWTLAATSEIPEPITHAAARGPFQYVITDRGEVESSSNVEVRCEVKSQGTGGTALLEIVDEGTQVKEGDFLAKLDDSSLQNEYTQQQIVVNTSAATLIQARNVYETALIAKEEYLHGTFRQEEQTIESEIFVAEETLRNSQEWANHSEKLAAKGFITEVQLDADRFAVENARKQLELAQTRLNVLREYTKKKMVDTLSADIATAKAQLEAEEKSHQLDVDKLNDIQLQIERCTILAPAAGQVVYANEESRRGEDFIVEPGALFREGQAMIRLPDSTQMQVSAKINEAHVDLVRAGMPVTIRVDAFRTSELYGEVTKVDDYPIPGGWFSSAAREYGTDVRVIDPPSGLRPGMTAEVRIFVREIPDALQVPVQAVFEHGDAHYGLTWKDGELTARQIQLGVTNDKFVVIEDGVEEGDVLVMSPRNYLDFVELGELPEKADKRLIADRVPGGSDAADAERDASIDEALANRAAGRPTAPRGGGDAAPGPRAEGQGGPGGRPGGGQGDPQAMVSMMLQRMDTDQDGRLSSSELTAIPEERRSAMMAADANQDGFLDAGELGGMMARFRAQAGAGGGGGGEQGGAGRGATADGGGDG